MANTEINLPKWVKAYPVDNPNYRVLVDKRPGKGFQVAVVMLGKPGEPATLMQAEVVDKNGAALKP